MRTKILLATLSLAVAATSYAGAATSRVGGQGAPRSDASSSGGAPIGAETSKARVGIDTKDRPAVNRAYNRQFASNLSTSIGWTGDNQRCRAGKPSGRAQAATLESLNFVRKLGGLAPVNWNRKLSSKAQKAALIMSANNSLSHYPPRSWRCWTQTGYNAAGHSNLALAYPAIKAGGVIQQYMDDMGSSNIAAGHRRWLMYPDATQMGSGSTSTANAIWVLGPSREGRPNPPWVSWPTDGWFPGPLEPDGRWSLSAGNDNVDFSRARVKMKTMAGQGRRTHVYPVAVGYGKPTLVWDVRNIGDVGAYKVRVSGIRVPWRGRAIAHGYVVRLFQPTHKG